LRCLACVSGSGPASCREPDCAVGCRRLHTFHPESIVVVPRPGGAMGTKKWYSAFVSVDRPEAERTGRPDTAGSVADIAATIAPEPQFTTPVKNPNAFDQIYSAAEIAPPPNGYTILKVADMLQSDLIRTAPVDMRKSSILLALDAAGVPLKSVIEDAIRRDRALDTYERVQQKAFEELQAKKQEENRQIEAEIEKLVAEWRSRSQANDEAGARE